MRDPNQQFIFNDQELSLIKNTFAENEPLLYSVRKVLLQFPLTDPEKNLLKLSMTPEVIAALKKRILPEISDEFPIGQLPSLLTTLNEQLKVRSVEEMGPLFAAKKIEIDYLTQQFALLGNIDLFDAVNAPSWINLSDLGVIKLNPNNDTLDLNYTRINAYLFLLGYIDPMLNFIRAIAGEKKETMENLKKRLTRDSSK